MISRQQQTGDLDKKLDDEIFSIKIRALVSHINRKTKKNSR